MPPLYHPNEPNCILTLVTRADQDEAQPSGSSHYGDVWDDELVTTPGDQTPGYTEIFSGEAGAFRRERPRFVPGGDQGSTYYDEVTATVTQAIGQVEPGDAVTLRDASGTTTYSVERCQKLTHPDTPLFRLYFRPKV